jgi:UV DNA damage endonuclease
LSTHPGQYTVLNSERAEVRAAAVAELEVQASLLDAMELGPEAVVVLHVGGGAGGIASASDRFLEGFEQLSDRARARLVIENDDRVFGVSDVLAISGRTGLRVVFDLHHHYCHNPNGLRDRDALTAALATWPAGETPKLHFSSPRLDLGVDGRAPELRAHADLIDPIAFLQFIRETGAGLDFDVMLEAKAKDLALLRLRTHLD